MFMGRMSLIGLMSLMGLIGIRTNGAYGFCLREDEVLVLVEEDFFAATHFLYN